MSGRRRSSSSERWLRRQSADPYVKEAKQRGYRSRAAFKLQQLDERFGLFAPGQRVLDLGAAPGSWSQVALERIGSEGRLLGVDLLEIAPLPGAQFLRGDFLDAQVQRQMGDWLGGAGADLIMSDMAPNMSGVKVTDQLRSADLMETCWHCASGWLKPGGTLLLKVFVGEGWDALLRQLRGGFDSVKIHKPPASRAQSRETYACARGMYRPTHSADAAYNPPQAHRK